MNVNKVQRILDHFGVGKVFNMGDKSEFMGESFCRVETYQGNFLIWEHRDKYPSCIRRMNSSKCVMRKFRVVERLQTVSESHSELVHQDHRYYSVYR